MDFNRNQFMLIGVVLLFLGIQLRMVDSYVLTESSARFLAKQTQAERASAFPLPAAMTAPSLLPAQHRRIQPPRWLSWAFISAGVILSLHSLAMKKPGT